MTVNWPEEAISLYDLAQIMDVCLNFASSAGIEMMMLGIPCVMPRTHFVTAYDPSISYLGEDLAGYRTAIQRAVDDGWSIENVRRAVRWWGFLFDAVGIDISDGFTYPSAGYIPAADASSSKSLKREVIQLLARYGPPALEIKHIVKRRNLKSDQILADQLRAHRRYVMSPRQESTSDIEQHALAAGVMKVHQVMAASWGAESRILRNFEEFAKHANGDVTRRN